MALAQSPNAYKIDQRVQARRAELAGVGAALTQVFRVDALPEAFVRLLRDLEAREGDAAGAPD